MDIKQKFREEKNMDVYAKDVTDGSFSNIYVKWLEQQLLLHNVSQQRELLSWMKENHHLAKTEEQINEMLLDYNFEQLNCG